jgi:hypothetical protein
MKLHKIVGLFLFIFIFVLKAEAFSCKYETPEKKLETANYVFTGKILSKSEDVADLSVTKVYKGPSMEKVQITFPGSLAKGYRLLRNLEIGETYIFSSPQPITEDSKLLKIYKCSWFNNIKNHKEIIDTLEKLKLKKENK